MKVKDLINTIMAKLNIRFVVRRFIDWYEYIKDYERIAHDYSRVLCHATQNKMSKINYDVDTVYAIIDETQQEFYYGIIKDDLSEIIKHNGTIKDIKKYIDSL